MAGHSQFKNIMHRKGKQDAQKSKLFGKLAREITVAAKMGQPDPAMNARLRAAIISARQENMSKDSIERAVKKASGGDSENYDEIRYEGYGPGGVAVIVEALTDNRNRAASDIRSYFTKVRRQSRRNRLGRLHVRSHRHHRIRRQQSLRRRDAGCRDRGRRRRRDLERKRPRDLRLAGNLSRGCQGAGSEIRRSPQGGADLEAAEHDRRSTTRPARSC